jgi:aspartyl-tRNA(Asn)/glutamyl-tRNA(Gln) amidotransferase subunit A
MNMSGRTARQLRQDIAAGSISAVEACRMTLDRVSSVNRPLNAFNHVDAERALERAASIDRRRAAGDPLGPLAGVPIAIKDNMCVRGMRTTASSKILDRFVPPYDATLCSGWRMPAPSSSARRTATSSRWDHPTRTPPTGPCAIPGTWTPPLEARAAVRLRRLRRVRSPRTRLGHRWFDPSARVLLRVVGLKPTYGRVSRYGLLAFASSLDQIGPFASTVGDAALALSAIAGHDSCDSTSSTAAVPDFSAALTGDVRGVRVGVPRAFVSEGVDDRVRAAFDSALDTLRDSGATLIDIDLPHAKLAIPVYYLICTAEASSNLARYDGVKYGYRSPAANDSLKAMYSKTRDEGFGAEVKRRIMLGTYVLSAGYYDAFYLKAQQVRTLLRRDYEQAFTTVDVVAMPTSPTPPFRLGEKTDDPLQMYLADIFTVSVNLAGLPGVSVPCGFCGWPAYRVSADWENVRRGDDPAGG